MPDPFIIALVAFLIAWTGIVQAIVARCLPLDWWPCGRNVVRVEDSMWATDLADPDAEIIVAPLVREEDDDAPLQ